MDGVTRDYKSKNTILAFNMGGENISSGTLLEYDGKFDKIAVYLFLLGICFAYFANLIRMILIIIVGHYYGIEALIFVHNNLGWLIFTLWIFIFIRILSSLVPTNITSTSN